MTAASSTRSAHDPGDGLLLIVSGPSGSGKSTLVDELVQSGEFPITFSVSATTRPPRAGEIDGVHYRFFAAEQFEQMRQRQEFLEYAQVHGHWYGTPKSPVEQTLAAGRWMLLEIDIEGHRQVKRFMPQAVSFFIRAPSIEGYEERLKARGTETPQSLQKRVADAKEQLLSAGEYDYQVLNETVPQAVRTFRALLWGIQAMRGT